MFKLIIIAVVVYIFIKKMPRTKALASQKLNENAPAAKAAVSQVKEQGRGILIQLLIAVIGLLTGLLRALVGSDDSNLPTVRK